MRPAGRDPSAPAASFDDLRPGAGCPSLRFGAAEQEIVAWTLDEVPAAIEAAQAAAESGRWAFGFVAYEAGAGLDPALPAVEPEPGLPLVWFGLADAPAAAPEHDDPSEPGDFHTQQWAIEWSPAEFGERVEAVRAAIGAGETYQCNLTTRMRSRVRGDLFAYYRALAGNQRGGFNAYLDLGRWVVLSASPECFLDWDGHVLSSVPMKGTARRAPTPAGDEAAREALALSPKDRAENVMIVDLIRNDMAKLAVPGSVEVSELFACEKYPTVWQLTSTVRARTRPGIGLVDVFAAMFPCGSVTGAPKVRTMQILAGLESSPRGVYCGAVGYVAPPVAAGGPPRARFNVAIRTVVVDRADDTATYGVGGGITWGSTPAGEYAEVLAKSAVLEAARAPASIDLLETFAVRAGRAVNLAEHLDRMQASAAYFDVPFDRGGALARVGEAADRLGEAVIRLRLRPDGELLIEPRDPGPALDGPVELVIDDVPVDPASPYLTHKTSRREVYEAARARHPGSGDVVLVNSAGRVTETTVANLLVRLGDSWFTPPIGDGCLPGVGRRLELETGRATERSLTVADLRAADEINVVNSARGRRPARLRQRP